MNADISTLVERLRRDAIGAQYEGDDVTHDEAITALVALETERVRLETAVREYFVLYERGLILDAQNTLRAALTPQAQPEVQS